MTVGIALLSRRAALRTAIAALLLPLGGALAAAEVPKVVVSIKPLHALVAAVMDGVGAPVLLIKGGADPHTSALKPSEARELDSAKIVVWAGPGVETFLAKPVKALAGKARVVQLDAEKSLTRLKPREGGVWEPHVEGDDHDHAHGDKHTHGHKDHAVSHGEIDGHLWLDPNNAVAIVRVAVRELSAMDRDNAAKYAANGAAAEAGLKALDAELRRVLAPVKARRFIVSHDSLQYFERRYGLAAAGSIAISPDKPPSAKRLYDLRSRILKERIVCVFGEPQHSDRLVRTVVDGTKARTGVIDTDGGVAVPEGKDAYATMMRNLAAALTGCLGAK